MLHRGDGIIMNTQTHPASELDTRSRPYLSFHPLTSTPVSASHTRPSSSSTTRSSSDTSSVSLPVTDTLSDTLTTQSHGSTLIPGELEVPIVGYEIVEERAKFTVYKIQVFRGECENWFIFRRYTDFCRLNAKLTQLFPHFRLALPPKKWFGDNYDPEFLEDRVLGLQAFINNLISNREVCNSEPVKEFLCVESPPGPHDSLEDSRALCDYLETQLYALKQEIQTKDAKLALLQDECLIYRQEVSNLRQALRLERNISTLSPNASSEASDSSLVEREQDEASDNASSPTNKEIPENESVADQVSQSDVNCNDSVSNMETGILHVGKTSTNESPPAMQVQLNA